MITDRDELSSNLIFTICTPRSYIFALTSQCFYFTSLLQMKFIARLAIVTLLLSILRSIDAICGDKEHSSPGIDYLNDFSISLTERISHANKAQISAAKKFASSSLKLNLESSFQKLQIGNSDRLIKLLKRLEKDKKQCIKLGITPFCREFFEYILTGLSPKSETIITDAANSIAEKSYERIVMTELSFPFKRFSKAKISNNSGDLTFNKTSISTTSTTTKTVFLRSKECGDEKICDKFILSPGPFTIEVSELSSEKLVSRSELNQETILLVEDLLRLRISESLLSQGYSYVNAPQDLMNKVMKKVFDELENSLKKEISKDPSLLDTSGIVSKYMFSYFVYACNDLKNESLNRQINNRS